MFVFFFFFQAEDGIRDDLVTGVQTCALPISTEFMERATRKRSAKPGRMAASGLPIGTPLTLPSGFARARRSRSSIRLKLSPVSSRLLGRCCPAEEHVGFFSLLQSHDCRVMRKGTELANHAHILISPKCLRQASKNPGRAR